MLMGGGPSLGGNERQNRSAFMKEISSERTPMRGLKSPPAKGVEKKSKKKKKVNRMTNTAGYPQKAPSRRDPVKVKRGMGEETTRLKTPVRQRRRKKGEGVGSIKLQPVAKGKKDRQTKKEGSYNQPKGTTRPKLLDDRRNKKITHNRCRLGMKAKKDRSAWKVQYRPNQKKKQKSMHKKGRIERKEGSDLVVGPLGGGGKV